MTASARQVETSAELCCKQDGSARGKREKLKGTETLTGNDYRNNTAHNNSFILFLCLIADSTRVCLSACILIFSRRNDARNKMMQRAVCAVRSLVLQYRQLLPLSRDICEIAFPFNVNGANVIGVKS